MDGAHRIMVMDVSLLVRKCRRVPVAKMCVVEEQIFSFTNQPRLVAYPWHMEFFRALRALWDALAALARLVGRLLNLLP
jgi:hypothetical protein